MSNEKQTETAALLADLRALQNGLNDPADVLDTIDRAAREIERLRAAIRTALSFGQMTHVHAALREAVGYGE